MGGLLNSIVEYYEEEEILKADGFDDAVIGIEESSHRLIYSVGKCIEILMLQDLSLDEAIEFFDFNEHNFVACIKIVLYRFYIHVSILI